jgi:hypothetical protein
MLRLRSHTVSLPHSRTPRPRDVHDKRAPRRHTSTDTPDACVVLCVSARPSPTEAKCGWKVADTSLISRSSMPSRQERRKAERDAAKRAPRADAAGAAGAAAALGNLGMNVGGDWTTQAEDPWVLIRAVGAEIVRQRARAGDREAQFSQGYKLVSDADEGVGTMLGEGGRSPKADVGFALCTAQFPGPSTDCDASKWSPNDQLTNGFCGCQAANPGQRRAWRFWSRRHGKGTRTRWTCWGLFTSRGRNTSLPRSGSPRAPRQGCRKRRSSSGPCSKRGRV